jgi:hypothetical protein
MSHTGLRKTSKAKAKGKGCWYYVTAYACVLCGHSEEYRERRWTQKPKDPAKRGEYHETACSSHFL